MKSVTAAIWLLAAAPLATAVPADAKTVGVGGGKTIFSMLSEGTLFGSDGMFEEISFMMPRVRGWVEEEFGASEERRERMGLVMLAVAAVIAERMIEAAAEESSGGSNVLPLSGLGATGLGGGGGAEGAGNGETVSEVIAEVAAEEVTTEEVVVETGGPSSAEEEPLTTVLGSGVDETEGVNEEVDWESEVAPVPLPAALPLFLAGLGSLLLFRRFRS